VLALVVACGSDRVAARPDTVADAGAGTGAAQAFVLVDRGRPSATVVYDGDAPELRAAIDDLVHYVERISGARLDVVPGTVDRPGPTLHIGRTSLYEHLSASADAVVLDGFAMKRVGEDLVVAGRLPQGTVNAVMTLLQDHFGVRWYFRGELWEQVPRRATLAIAVAPNTADGAYVENPAFLMRYGWADASSARFAMRSRNSLAGVKLPFVGTGHDLVHVVNPQKFGDRPEYFAFWDGRRHVEHDVHPCFTHPDMPEVFLDAVRQGHYAFGVNDNVTACRCERCLAVDGGSEPYLGMVNVSESYFQLMARVAAESARIRPDMRLGVFAYQITNAPPRTVERIGDNVDVVLCQDTALYFDEEHRKTDQAMSAEWVRQCGHVRFYDYIGLSYWTPRYFPRILADQMRHIAAAGVAGYGTHSGSMVDSSMPMFYLLNRLLWNPRLDADALIAEMLTDLYGPAAGPIAAFYGHWEACWQRQQKAVWLFGIDDFRGEMSIYTWDDFEKGRVLLEEAATLARQAGADEKVHDRVAWLGQRYAFTWESARVFTVSMDAIRWTPTPDHREAIRISNGVVDAWAAWEKQLNTAVQLDGTSLEGWVGKTGMVRTWSLKQQMRDAVLAPLIRWVCAHEGLIPPCELRFIEQTLAGTAMLNRSRIESRVTERVNAVAYPPRVDGLLVADAFRVEAAPAMDAGAAPWPGAGTLDAAPWTWLDRSAPVKAGKYDDPVEQHRMIMSIPPVFDDLSIEAQAAWDEQCLYLRVDARDERHVHGGPGSAMWKADSIRLALTPDRDNFLYDVHSWTYIWGGYRGCELEIGVSLGADGTLLHIEQVPEGLAAELEPRSLIRAVARRHHPHTVYVLAIDWRLLPGFAPRAEKSVGFWLTVNDSDQGELVSAEYGSAINRVKRPTGFSAVRLAERPGERPGE